MAASKPTLPTRYRQQQRATSQARTRLHPRRQVLHARPKVPRTQEDPQDHLDRTRRDRVRTIRVRVCAAGRDDAAEACGGVLGDEVTCTEA